MRTSILTPPRPLRVCLILHSTRSDNLGVGALTASEVEIIRGIARDLEIEIEIEVMDWKDARVPYVTGPDIRITDLDGRTMVNPRGFFATAHRSDVVIDIGGGDSFADIYGGRRLRRIFVLKYLTHLSGTPLVLAPQTIGPFTKVWSRWLAKISLARAALISTRDEKSTQAVRNMGVAGKVIEASDVALRLPFNRPVRRPDGRVHVGINVSGLLMNGGYSGGNDFDMTLNYPNLIRSLITWFQSHTDNCTVHLIPHVIVTKGRMAMEDDYRASLKLSEEFPDAVLAPAFTSPSEAKAYIAGLDFFMGARMHACIAAFSSGVPVVPMAYSRKFEGLFGTLGYERTVDCTSERGDEIEAKIHASYRDRAHLAREAQTALKIGLDKLHRYEDELKDLLGTLAKRL